MSRNFEILQRATSEENRPANETLVFAAKRVPKPNPRALPHEEMIKLIQRLFLLPDRAEQRVVVFTGMQSGSGCSSVLAGAAEALAAQTDRTVCLVDANVESPSLHLCFGVQNVKGLSNAVAEPGQLAEFVQKLHGRNLWLLPCGSNPSRLSAVVGAERLRSRIEELRKEFGYVLVDSPPVSRRVDAVLLGKLADGVVLLLEANVTRREAARVAKEMFESAQVRLLGAVLNKRTFPIPASLYRRL